MIIDYDILTTITKDDMLSRVKEKLKEDYEPLGPVQVALAVCGDGMLITQYTQTLVKRAAVGAEPF
jgi:predicted ATP-grasp superfamily ATP-dependent carboligase